MSMSLLPKKHIFFIIMPSEPQSLYQGKRRTSGVEQECSLSKAKDNHDQAWSPK